MAKKVERARVIGARQRVWRLLNPDGIVRVHEVGLYRPTSKDLVGMCESDVRWNLAIWEERKLRMLNAILAHSAPDQKVMCHDDVQVGDVPF